MRSRGLADLEAKEIVMETKDKGRPEPGKQYRLTGGTGTPAISNGNTWAESEVGGEADVTAKIKARIDQYIQIVDQYNLDYYARNKFTFESAPKAEAEYGSRYAKIRHPGRGVHSFIDMKNGDILKAASYKAPAKNGVRGNIWSEDIGRSVINEHGCNYLK